MTSVPTPFWRHKTLRDTLIKLGKVTCKVDSLGRVSLDDLTVDEVEAVISRMEMLPSSFSCDGIDPTEQPAYIRRKADKMRREAERMKREAESQLIKAEAEIKRAAELEAAMAAYEPEKPSEDVTAEDTAAAEEAERKRKASERAKKAAATRAKNKASRAKPKTKPRPRAKKVAAPSPDAPVEDLGDGLGA